MSNVIWCIRQTTNRQITSRSLSTELSELDPEGVLALYAVVDYRNITQTNVDVRSDHSLTIAHIVETSSSTILATVLISDRGRNVNFWRFGLYQRPASNRNVKI